MKLTCCAIFITLFLLISCRTTSAPTPTPTQPATPAAVPPTLGAGFRFSTYGPFYDPGPAYWASVGWQMAGKFPGASPQAIWIVGNYGIAGPVFTFPGTHEDFNIHFSSKDNNEEALTLFDQIGLQVWLQVEPGNEVPVEELIHIMLNQYGHHPSVMGVGIDVEWFHSDGDPGGRAVTDEEATAWLAAARSHNPAYRLFLKHWEQEKMPPTVREGILFVDDEQQFDSLDDMVAGFAAWGRAFAPAPVAFQYGYTGDQKWWKELPDPPADIGRGSRAW
ncbi:MAG: hypothetical protein L0332_27980 [Chloroflexi bacterium]|nr:hypothetical protein [Chloroflexota bacterium]MCI0645919.1 hypothetical protein [Chloroflexota bacterium]MCI0730539.1 hypothetical protein [Chloroflexota bacterium]